VNSETENLSKTRVQSVTGSQSMYSLNSLVTEIGQRLSCLLLHEVPIAPFIRWSKKMKH
jgi:hypothetical protein